MQCQKQTTYLQALLWIWIQEGQNIPKPHKKKKRNDTLLFKELNFLSDELKLEYTSHGGQARNVYFFTFKFSNVVSYKNRGLNQDSGETPGFGSTIVLAKVLYILIDKSSNIVLRKQLIFFAHLYTGFSALRMTGCDQN